MLKKLLAAAATCALLIGVLWTLGAPAAQAQEHPFEEMVIFGVNEDTGKVDQTLVLTVAGLPSVTFVLDLPPYEARPSSVVWNGLLPVGSHYITGAGQECVLNVDELRTPEEFDFTQSHTMDWEDGVTVTVSTEDGGHAWFWMKCLYPQAPEPEDPQMPELPTPPVFESRFYTGTLESTGELDPSYRLEIDGNQDFVLTIPETPESVSWAITLRTGEFVIQGVGDNCTLYIDEDRTSDPWDATQSHVMDWENGTPISITTSDGGDAWARLLCTYEEDEGGNTQVFLPVVQDGRNPLSGTSYIGVNEMSGQPDEQYRLIWVFWELQLVRPDNPEPVAFALDISRGRYWLALPSACTLYLDEQFVGGVLEDPTKASQSIAMSPSGVGFTVNPANGEGQAWGALKCS